MTQVISQTQTMVTSSAVEQYARIVAEAAAPLDVESSVDRAMRDLIGECVGLVSAAGGYITGNTDKHSIHREGLINELEMIWHALALNFYVALRGEFEQQVGDFTQLAERKLVCTLDWQLDHSKQTCEHCSGPMQLAVSVLLYAQWAADFHDKGSWRNLKGRSDEERAQLTVEKLALTASYLNALALEIGTTTEEILAGKLAASKPKLDTFDCLGCGKPVVTMVVLFVGYVEYDAEPVGDDGMPEVAHVCPNPSARCRGDCGQVLTIAELTLHDGRWYCADCLKALRV